MVKGLTQNPSLRSDVINDRNGQTLTENTEIKARWAEYCKELYDDQNHIAHHTPNIVIEPEPPPLIDEIRQALRQISSGKSPGVDDIPIELWKASGEDGIQILWELCGKIWKSAEWLKDWVRAVFIPLPKKGKHQGMPEPPHHQLDKPCQQSNSQN